MSSNVRFLLFIGMLITFQETILGAPKMDLPAKFGQRFRKEQKVLSKRGLVNVKNDGPCGADGAPYECRPTGGDSDECLDNYGKCEQGICCFNKSIPLQS